MPRRAVGSAVRSCHGGTSYASCGDLSLAYQVFGDGPVELVFAGPFASHVELYWTLPEFKAFFEPLPPSVGSSCSTRPDPGCRSRSRKFARSMIERPRSRPSWTPSASEGAAILA